MSPRWALASPLSPPSPLSSRHSLQLSLHLQLLLGLSLARPVPEGREERGADLPCCPPHPAGSRPGSWRTRASCGAVCMCWSHRLQRERATVGCAGRPDRRGGPRRPLHVGQAGAAPDSPGTEPRSPPSPAAAPRQRGLRPRSWYSSLVVQAPPHPPPPACHPSCPEKALGRGPCGNRGSPLSCCRQQPEVHSGPHWSRAQPGPDVTTAPKAWVHNPGFSGLPCVSPT